ncbi:uncharacterized protein FOBCDRAFT_226103 [Fusarium oxysporum Fo47]|uniref:uncharacterized protein n=1 Tax=Fusarium oxysporum Fo47 TaxID=660027 RepID=UPI002319138A|nr:uncharacterized protein FOBCDRAFT_226103 [Fusarium oxysporum Fo47]KAJ4134617.1 hypothetical protein NW765_008661 [Fusarium oxysporum]WJG35556.1 hypothetical protein FOBCDRAFT_226103 [Fusarium oxysporum Fo47]
MVLCRVWRLGLGRMYNMLWVGIVPRLLGSLGSLGSSFERLVRLHFLLASSSPRANPNSQSTSTPWSSPQCLPTSDSESAYPSHQVIKTKELMLVVLAMEKEFRNAHLLFLARPSLSVSFDVSHLCWFRHAILWALHPCPGVTLLTEFLNAP